MLMNKYIPMVAVVMLTGCVTGQKGPDVEKHPWSGKTVVFSNDPDFPDRILLNYTYDCPGSAGPEDVTFRNVAGRKAVVESVDGSVRMKFTEKDEYICYDLQRSSRDVKEDKPPEHAFFEKDIENIRKMTGKTFWTKGFYVNTAKTGYHKDRVINLYNTEPVEITGVCPPTPYHFYVEVKNSRKQRGCIPLDNRLDLEDTFFVKNPIRPDWDEKTVDAIISGSFFIGMPAGALEISWGKPQEVKHTLSSDVVHEQWIYGDWGPYIYLDNGKVISRKK